MAKHINLMHEGRMPPDVAAAIEEAGGHNSRRTRVQLERHARWCDGERRRREAAGLRAVYQG